MWRVLSGVRYRSMRRSRVHGGGRRRAIGPKLLWRHSLRTMNKIGERRSWWRNRITRVINVHRNNVLMGWRRQCQMRRRRIWYSRRCVGDRVEARRRHMRKVRRAVCWWTARSRDWMSGKRLYVVAVRLGTLKVGRQRELTIARRARVADWVTWGCIGGGCGRQRCLMGTSTVRIRWVASYRFERWNNI